jgi:hypothetical protein
MTITALLVAAIGLSVIAIMSSNNSNVSEDDAFNQYNRLVEHEIRSHNGFPRDTSRSKFLYNVDSVDTNVDYNESGSGCYNLGYFQSDVELSKRFCIP